MHKQEADSDSGGGVVRKRGSYSFSRKSVAQKKRRGAGTGGGKRKAARDDSDSSDSAGASARRAPAKRGAAAGKGKASQRRRGNGQVKYNDDSDDEDLLESDEKEVYRFEKRYGTADAKPCPIDKILGKDWVDGGEGEEKVCKYLVKWRDRSYLHTSWEEESVLLDHGGKQRLQNFEKKWAESLRWEVDDRGGDFFDPSYAEVERVYASKMVRAGADSSGESGGEEKDGQEGAGEHEEYLCKWKNLQYAESTWESKDAIIQSVGEAGAARVLEAFRAFRTGTNTHAHTHTHAHTCICIHIYIYIYINIYIYIYLSICTYIHACIHACIDTHTHTHTHIHIHMHMYIHVHVNIHVNIHVHVHVHVHIHVLLKQFCAIRTGVYIGVQILLSALHRACV